MTTPCSAKLESIQEKVKKLKEGLIIKLQKISLGTIQKEYTNIPDLLESLRSESMLKLIVDDRIDNSYPYIQYFWRIVGSIEKETAGCLTSDGRKKIESLEKFFRNLFYLEYDYEKYIQTIKESLNILDEIEKTLNLKQKLFY